MYKENFSWSIYIIAFISLTVVTSPILAIVLLLTNMFEMETCIWLGVQLGAILVCILYSILSGKELLRSNNFKVLLPLILPFMLFTIGIVVSCIHMANTLVTINVSNYIYPSLPLCYLFSTLYYIISEKG